MARRRGYVRGKLEMTVCKLLLCNYSIKFVPCTSYT